MPRSALALLTALAVTGCATSTARMDLTGRYVANPDASQMLPGDSTPPGFVFEIVDDGETLATTQTFTSPSGEPVHLQWRGACDGVAHAVEGTLVPTEMSCRRAADGALINTVDGQYSETCRLTSARRLVCAGEMPAPNGQAQPFSYVFDRL